MRRPRPHYYLSSGALRAFEIERTRLTSPFVKQWNEASNERSGIRVPNCAGVYFVEAVGTGFVKVGRSKNIAERVATLRANNGALLRLLRWDKGGAREERALHGRYDYYRSHGEWFIVFPHLASHVGCLPASLYAIYLEHLDRVQGGDFSRGTGIWPDDFNVKTGAFV